jgi:poly-beta-1,6-N-acetyl-D-glucosamine synthase
MISARRAIDALSIGYLRGMKRASGADSHSCAAVDGHLDARRGAERRSRALPPPAPITVGTPTRARKPSCVLLASRNGAAHVTEAIERVRHQCPVFLVSDASTDDTAGVAERAGAEVLALEHNVGKPAAIAEGMRHFRICERFETVVVIDDDTTLSPDFVRRCLARMRGGVAIVVGTTTSDWRRNVRWNPWVASRAFTYWRYQLFVRRGQSMFNVMNCISGSNSMYRTDLLADLVSRPTPYIVDDTYWTLETHRKKLGRIVYAPEAVAAVQDPTDLRSWYRQNVRWLWGTMQGIRGHRVGRQFSVFDVAYVGLMFDWMLHVLLWPAMLAVMLVTTDVAFGRAFGLYLVGYFLWAAIGAIALRRWRLLALFPALIAIDWIYRVVYVHAFVKTIRRPLVDSCVWDSPARYETR